MTAPDAHLPRHELLGFEVNPGSLEDYLAYLDARVRERRPCTVLYHNLHSLYAYFTDAALRRAYHETGGAESVTLVDGMPVIWLMRACGLPVDGRQRLTYVDFIMPLLRLARDRDWAVFHVGQDRATLERALERVRREVPGIRIDGHDGYFDKTPGSAGSEAVLERIAAHGSRLVLVGLGAPAQERWIAAHRARIDAPAVLACGACMEYVAGAVATPPRWMGRAGLEWLFRLGGDPRRFAFRYAVEPVLLGAMLLYNAARARGLGRRIGA